MPNPAQPGTASHQDTAAACPAPTAVPVAAPAGRADEPKGLAGLIGSVREQADGELILAPVDFSPHSEQALLFAARLAEAMSATLVVLHVVHDPARMPGYYGRLVKKKQLRCIQDMAREALDDFMAGVIDRHRALESLPRAARLLVAGLPVTRILQVAEQLEPSMVVLGSQGRTGLQRLFVGSVAEQVVHLCRRPVNVVKHPG